MKLYTEWQDCCYNDLFAVKLIYPDGFAGTFFKKSKEEEIKLNFIFYSHYLCRMVTIVEISGDEKTIWVE